MAISGIGSSYGGYGGVAGIGCAGGASGANAAGCSGAAPSTADGSSDSAFEYLVNYLKESPAKRMEDAWLAQHHLSEQALAAMPPAQQDAIRKQMASDIKKKLQETSGAPGANANVVA